MVVLLLTLEIVQQISTSSGFWDTDGLINIIARNGHGHGHYFIFIINYQSLLLSMVY
jgi:hypothetical protein